MKGRARFRSLAAYVKARLDTEPRLTQERIAADLGVSPSALSHYLAKRRTPQARTALRIAKVARVPVEALLSLEQAS